MNVGSIFTKIGEMTGITRSAKPVKNNHDTKLPVDSIDVGNASPNDEKSLNGVVPKNDSAAVEKKESSSETALTVPKRDDFKSEEEFDMAFINFQSGKMAELKDKYSHSYYGGILFHGCELSPDEVFKKGIPAKGGDDFNLKHHQMELDKEGKVGECESGLRGGCINAIMPAKFAGEDGYVYKLAPIGGAIEIDSALYNGTTRNPVTLEYETNKLSAESEISFGSRQPGYRILGCHKVGKYSRNADMYRLGKFIENPNYDPDR